MRIALARKLWIAMVLVAVAGVAYSAGAIQAGKPTNTPAAALKWEPYGPGSPLQVVPLWGDRTKAGDYAILLKMPANSEAGRHSHTNDYHGVAVQGTWVHTNDGGKAPDLGPGSVVFQPGKQVHNDVCKGAVDCIVMIHQRGPADFIPAK